MNWLAAVIIAMVVPTVLGYLLKSSKVPAEVRDAGVWKENKSTLHC